MIDNPVHPVEVPQGDLRAIAEQHTALYRKTSRESCGPCPWCGGTDRFIVRPGQNNGAGYFNCRGCHRHGDTIGYLMQHDGLDLLTACRVLDPAFPAENLPRVQALRGQRTSGPGQAMPPIYDWQARGEQFVAAAVARLWSARHQDTDRVLTYLHEQRGLGDAALQRWQIGYNPHDVYDEPQAWGLASEGKVFLPRGIVIPHYDEQGTLWGIKVRLPVPSDGEHRYRAIAGSKPTLYGVQTLAGHDVAIVTEGELDACLLHQEAGDLVGVVTLGSTEGKLDGRGLAALLPMRRVLAAYDADQPGQHGAGRLAAVSARVRVVRPLVGKDLTDMYLAGGDLRAWVTYNVARHVPPAESPMATDAPIEQQDVSVQHPPVAPPIDVSPVLPARFPWRVQWAREMGYLSIRDMQTGEWLEVSARSCPDWWRDEARARKAAEKMSRGVRA